MAWLVASLSIIHQQLGQALEGNAKFWLPDFAHGPGGLGLQGLMRTGGLHFFEAKKRHVFGRQKRPLMISNFVARFYMWRWTVNEMVVSCWHHLAMVRGRLWVLNVGPGEWLSVKKGSRCVVKFSLVMVLRWCFFVLFVFAERILFWESV